MESLPFFPSFRKLSISDYDLFRSRDETLPPYSDTNFFSLFSWDTKDSCKISKLNENIIILFRDYLSSKICLMVIGDNQANHTMSEMYNFIKKVPYNGGVKYIPDYFAQNLDSNVWAVKESESANDYILSVRKLKEMHSWHQSSIPNAIRNCQRKYPNYQFNALPNHSLNWSLHIEIFKEWMHNHELDMWGNNEFKAFQRFTSLESNSLITFSISISGELKAFDCCELFNGQYAVAHFSKADKSIKGIYETLQWETAQYLNNRNIEFINIEQDLGLEGLRFSKMKYKPVFFLRKFNVKPILL